MIKIFNFGIKKKTIANIKKIDKQKKNIKTQTKTIFYIFFVIYDFWMKIFFLKVPLRRRRRAMLLRRRPPPPNQKHDVARVNSKNKKLKKVSENNISQLFYRFWCFPRAQYFPFFVVDKIVKTRLHSGDSAGGGNCPDGKLKLKGSFQKI